MNGEGDKHTKNPFYQVEEAIEKVTTSIKTLKEFKSCFQHYKAKLPSYFKGGKKTKAWEFRVRVVLVPFQGFMYCQNCSIMFFYL